MWQGPSPNKKNVYGIGYMLTQRKLNKTANTEKNCFSSRHISEKLQGASPRLWKSIRSILCNHFNKCVKQITTFDLKTINVNYDYTKSDTNIRNCYWITFVWVGISKADRRGSGSVLTCTPEPAPRQRSTRGADDDETPFLKFLPFLEQWSS